MRQGTYILHTIIICTYIQIYSYTHKHIHIYIHPNTLSLSHTHTCIQSHTHTQAIRTENGNFLGPRPMQIKKSEWKSRDVVEVHKKEKKKIKMLKDLGVLD